MLSVLTVHLFTVSSCFLDTISLLISLNIMFLKDFFLHNIDSNVSKFLYSLLHFSVCYAYLVVSSILRFIPFLCSPIGKT